MQETLVQFLGREDALEEDRITTPVFLGFLGGSDSKESTCNTGDLGLILRLERSTGKGMATHSSILAWRIPWTGEPDGLAHGIAESSVTNSFTFSF